MLKASANGGESKCMNIYEVLKAVGFGNMRPVSVIIALNRRASASQARSRAAGADCGRNPLRFSLFINCSTRARSRAEEKPHQAGDAYISEGRQQWLF